MAGIRDDSAGNYGTWDSSDLSWLDFIKATGSDVGNGAYNALSNITGALSPIGTSPEGNMALQVPPMITGIADSYRRLSDPTGPGNAYRLTGVPELDAPIQQDMSNVLLSLYGGNAVAGLAKPRNALGAGYAKGARPEPSARAPKAEAMSVSDVLAEKPHDAAYAKARQAADDAFLRDIEDNRHTYFDDWSADPDNPLVVDDWGQQIGGGEVSDAYDSAMFGGLDRGHGEFGKATAAALNAAATAAGRELHLSPGGYGGSFYGQLKTPAGNEYKVRASNHGRTSSLHDRPDFNIAPGEMSPDEFIRLLPTLLSDTGRPSIFGSALATAGEQQPARAYRGVSRDQFAGAADQPVWLSSSPDVASSYAGSYPFDPSPSVYPADLEFRNPMTFDAQGGGWGELNVGGKYMDSDELAALARSRGHDGLIMKNVVDGPDGVGVPQATTYAALRRNTVRSPLTGETLFSDTGRPSIFGSALATAGEQQTLPDWLKF